MSYAGRGCWVLPGGTQALWVMGSGCYLMTVATPASAYTPATFSLTQVGTLNTSSGPVCIRDNGIPGGVAVIVDGQYGYFYYFNSVNGVAGTFAQITDPDFLGATRVCYIDGWWVFNQPGTQVFYTPTSTYSTTFNASNYALKDGGSDLLVSMYETKEALWLLGGQTTEIWYDAGGTYFPFERLVSTMLQVGCAAPHSVARFNSNNQDGLIWLGISERGQNVIVKTVGYETQVVSTFAVNDAIASYQLVSDAIAFTYQEDGHEFYQITFPSADVTWVFDASTEMWHQRGYYDPLANQFHRHRAACFCNFQNQRLVADFADGSICRMTREVYTDNGRPLVSWRRAPIVWDGHARERVFLSSLQIEFAPGQGVQNGQGSNPQAYLTISRDGGVTYGNAIPAPLGAVGQYRNRTIWRRLGNARAAVFDVKVYDPVNRDIVGATLKKAQQ